MDRGGFIQNRPPQNQGQGLSQKFSQVASFIGNNETDYNKLHSLAEQIASELQLNSTKIRKFYNYVKKIKVLGRTADVKKDLNRFVAVLMYDTGREEGKGGLRQFAEGMKNVVEAVKNHPNIDKAYETFVDFFEALVAYHKYYEMVGGREGGRGK